MWTVVVITQIMSQLLDWLFAWIVCQSSNTIPIKNGELQHSAYDCILLVIRPINIPTTEYAETLNEKLKIFFSCYHFHRKSYQNSPEYERELEKI